ncbi:MAG TPA: DNA methyltransferase [Tepidisphaeraceae bacterium]|jgi:SAM-dependent methyltransferase
MPVRQTGQKLFDLADVPVDSTVSQDHLNIAGKVRSNLFPWNGQFSPQPIHALLQAYGHDGCSVLDPFLGSGTVLIEAGRLGMRGFGGEINPAACQMAQTYVMANVRPQDRRHCLERVDRLLFPFADSPLFSASEHCDGNVKDILLAVWKSEPDGPSKRLLQTLIVLLDFYREDLTKMKVIKRWNDLRNIVVGLPYSRQPLWVANCDARKLPLSDSEIDLVLTSPPYINVFNYHQQYRTSVEALGWNLLHVAKSEIGSNRKHRQNRFLTVIQYCCDIALALSELRRVTKTGGRIIFVVGRESNVLHTPLYNADIVANVAVRCVGLEAVARQERVFMNRFGVAICEDIIHFRPRHLMNGDALLPGDVAKEVLTTALSRAPKESVSDLEDAILRISQVKPSPIYKPLMKGGVPVHQPH